MNPGLLAAIDAATAKALAAGESPSTIALCLSVAARRVLRLPQPSIARRSVFGDADAVRTVLRAVAEFYGVDPFTYVSHEQRRANVSVQRQVVMWLAHRVADASYPAIGSVLGGRDKSTVIHGVQRIDRLLVENPTLREQVAALRGMLTVDDGTGKEGTSP